MKTKLMWGLWPLLILCAAYLLVLHVTPITKPKPLTPTQYQLLESRVEKLERGQKKLEQIVGLAGKEARKEGLQNRRTP